MSMRLMTLGLTATVIMAAPSAFADPYKYKPHKYDDGYRYRPQAEYAYARVVDVDPIMRRVRVERPVRECWDDVRYEEPRSHISDPQVGGRMLLGSIIGGVIGHQFGSGRGRDAATIAGAAIGAHVGRDNAARAQERSGYSEGREYTVERCETRYEEEFEERIDGYDVEYEYGGRTYHTRTPYEPGDRIRVRVDVRPTYEG